MPVLDLALPASPPQTIKLAVAPDANHVGLMPIELENGCSEKDCSIESDDPRLTNVVRRHYLEHFGHRDLNGMVSHYAEDAIMVNVVNGVRKSYHGKTKIQEAFVNIFKQHPTVNSTFQLKHIVIHDRSVMVIWTAKTPKHIFPQSSDNFLFDDEGKICKQFFNCQISELETPWYVDED